MASQRRGNNHVANIWAQMGYEPPRGQCNHKESLLSQRCPCLRFMIHPLKAATSFECDGCNHHASFHSMENAGEKIVVARWRSERVQPAPPVLGEDRTPPRKRARKAIEAPIPASAMATAAVAGAEADTTTTPRRQTRGNKRKAQQPDHPASQRLSGMAQLRVSTVMDDTHGLGSDHIDAPEVVELSETESVETATTAGATVLREERVMARLSRHVLAPDTFV